MLKRAKRRMIRTVQPAAALAATLTNVVQVEDVEHEAIVGASLLKVRDRLQAAGTREPVPVPPALAATLRDYQRQGLTWLVELTDLGLGACLADDMGLGKTVQVIALHLHRGSRADPRGLPRLAARQLGGGDPEVRAGRRRCGGSTAAVARASDEPRSRDDGFVLTTYGTMRRDAAALAEVGWDLVVADEAQHVKNAQSSTSRALRTIPSAARVALTGTPVENNLTELWAILDWAIPGLLGSRKRLPQGVGGAHRGGRRLGASPSSSPT